MVRYEKGTQSRRKKVRKAGREGYAKQEEKGTLVRKRNVEKDPEKKKSKRH